MLRKLVQQSCAFHRRHIANAYLAGSSATPKCFTFSSPFSTSSSSSSSPSHNPHTPFVENVEDEKASSDSAASTTSISIDRSALHNPPGILLKVHSLLLLLLLSPSLCFYLWQSILTCPIRILSSSSTSKGSSRFTSFFLP